MKKIIYLILISGLVYLSFKFIEQRIYLNQIKKDSIELEKCIESFCFHFFGLYPQNQSDIARVMTWSKEVLGPINIKSIDNGLNVYYDSEINKIIIYSFGKDNIDGKLKNTPFNSNSLNQKGQFDIFSVNIFKYIYYSLNSSHKRNF